MKYLIKHRKEEKIFSIIIHFRQETDLELLKYLRTVLGVSEILKPERYSMIVKPGELFDVLDVIDNLDAALWDWINIDGPYRLPQKWEQYPLCHLKDLLYETVEQEEYELAALVRDKIAEHESRGV